MGQYYKPINTEDLSWVYSWDYEGGLKLMEHSWMDNNFVGAVESLLKIGGGWYKKPLVWCGDYADETIKVKVASEDYKKGDMINYYQLANNVNKRFPTGGVVKEKYLYNHTKKEFVDKKKVPKNPNGWRIHPLPLLTCSGNGRGGGDFYVDGDSNKGNFDLIGSWAGDIISVEPRKPIKKMGFKEIEFDLIENW